jgi:metal-dependent amidase/aminoacylase/carboxypeptidase family protein
MSETRATKLAVRQAITAQEPLLIDLSHRIHANPEVAFQELKAARWLSAELKEAGFDVTEASLRVPSIHPFIGIDSWPSVNHQPEFAAHCITPAADRAVVDGAVAMAWTAIDLATDQSVLGGEQSKQ